MPRTIADILMIEKSTTRYPVAEEGTLSALQFPGLGGWRVLLQQRSSSWICKARRPGSDSRVPVNTHQASDAVAVTACTTELVAMLGRGEL